jgi:anti-sigma factor RsiW
VKHLTPDELVDAAESVLDTTRQRHLDTCDACRRQVESLRSLLREAASVPVPEPSPLFWDRFSARVRQAVAEERSPAVGWSRWFGWSTLAPACALAVRCDDRQPGASSGPGRAARHTRCSILTG